MKGAFIQTSENKNGSKKIKQTADGGQKNFIYFTTPHRLNQTSFQFERKRKEKAGGKKEIPFRSLPSSPPLPSLSFFPFSFLPSRFLSSPPLRPARCFALALCVSGAQ